MEEKKMHDSEEPINTEKPKSTTKRIVKILGVIATVATILAKVKKKDNL